ncbi:MAG: hypothetical protein MK097_16245 [Dechloromonas sp.]|nr:hypothetical protein [Dechloromonas sp.]
MKRPVLTLLLSSLLLSAGCATVPPTNVHQPMTARPSARHWDSKSVSG